LLLIALIDIVANNIDELTIYNTLRIR